MPITTKRLTEYQRYFMKHNYPDCGSEWCAEQLGLSPKTVQRFCNRNKIYITAERKKKNSVRNITKAHIKNNTKLAAKKLNEYQVNPSPFLLVTEPYIAYILGLLWADGYVLKKKNCDRIEISALATDLDEVKHLFAKIGNWNIYRRQRKNRLPQLTITTNNKILSQFLYENNYSAESNGAPDKILSHIPNHLRCYWFRGLFDGAGCLYMSKTANQCSITSDYEQDWNYLENLLSTLRISYTIKRNSRVNKNHKTHTSSVIRITNKHDIKSFLTFIYQSREEDSIGYSRKYDKYLKLIEMPDKIKPGPKQKAY